MTTRTSNQQASIEIYCRRLAEALNDAGMDMKKVFEVKSVSVPWSQDLVKDVLWREIQVAMFDKKSTTKLNTKEVSEVYEVLNRHMAENFGVGIDFPSEQSLYNEAMSRFNKSDEAK